MMTDSSLKLVFRTFLCACTAALVVSACATNNPAESSCAYVENLLAQAATGDADKQFSVANLYGISSCLPDDRAQQVEWYRKAANQNHTRAMVRLARIYLYGSGVSKDKDRALRLYRQAATMGEVKAMRALGKMYERGKQVPKDLTEAEKWYGAAAVRKDRYSTKRLKLILGDRYSNRIRQLEIEREQKFTTRALERFGTVTVVSRETLTEVKDVSARIEGTRYRGLKSLVSIPRAAILVGISAGVAAVGAPYAFEPLGVLDKPSERTVRKLQEKMAELYLRHGDKDFLANLESQLAETIREQMPNPVVRIALPQPSDSVDYRRFSDVDTVVEIGTVLSGLALIDAKDEQALYLLHITYRVVSVRKDATIGEYEAAHKSSWRDYAAWSQHDGSVLEKEMRISYSEIAKKVVKNLQELVEKQSAALPFPL